MDKKKKLILLLGSYGQDNLGDEAILEILVKYFKKKGFNIVANSSNPSKTRRTYRIKTFHTSALNGLLEKAKYFYLSDIVVFGGGTLLIEHRDFSGKITRRPLYLTLLILILSKILSKKTVFLSIGVESIESRLGEMLAKYCLKLCDVVSVRDTKSLKYIKNLTDRRAILGSDIVFLHIPLPRKVKKKTKQILIGLAPNYWIKGNQRQRDKFVLFQYKILKALAENTKNKILLIPFNTGKNKLNDVWLCNKLARMAKSENVEIVIKNTPAEMIKLINKLDVLIAVRLHACIYGALCKLPIIAINYEQKMRSIMTDLDYSDRVINPNLNNINVVLDKVKKCSKYSNKQLLQCDDKLCKMRKRAKKMLEAVNL